MALAIVDEWSGRSDAQLWAAVRDFMDLGAVAVVPVIDPATKTLSEALDDPDRREMVSRRVRRGQWRLRRKLLDAYGARCAISGDSPHNVLEAAHISEHASTGVNTSTHGLLLRADLHALFDDRLLAVEPTRLQVRLHPSLRDTEYWQYEGRAIRPRMDGLAPDAAAVKARWVSSGGADW